MPTVSLASNNLWVGITSASVVELYGASKFFLVSVILQAFVNAPYFIDSSSFTGIGVRELAWTGHKCADGRHFDSGMTSADLQALGRIPSRRELLHLRMLSVIFANIWEVTLIWDPWNSEPTQPWVTWCCSTTLLDSHPEVQKLYTGRSYIVTVYIHSC